MIDYSKIPPSTLESLQAWIKTGRPLGGFGEAIVSNDLKEALGRADEANRAALFDIVAWMYNRAPLGSWGSPEALKTWPETLKRMKEGE